MSIDELVYATCRDCSQTIKRRICSTRPWVHCRTGRERSITPYEHDATPIDPPRHLASPRPRARAGWHGPPPS